MLTSFIPTTFVRASLVLAILLSAVAQANASTDSLSNCRKLTSAADRLACYDQIVLNKNESVNVVHPAISAAAPTPQSPTSLAPADAASQFGLAAISPAAKIDKISSTIKGRLASWQSNSLITLANGQVWKVIDDSRGVCECDNPKVTVSRASFGTFFLEIEGKGNAPRVKRIQ